MILSIIENISNEYGGPANSLPNFLHAIHKELKIHSKIYSIELSENESNEFIDRYELEWVNCKLTGIRKIMYSKTLAKLILADINHGDVIFSNNLWNYPAYLSAKLSSSHRLPHVISIRGTLYSWSLQQGYWRKKIAWHLFQKRALQNASVIHVTCEDEVQAVRALGVTSPIALVPHGINYDDYQQLPNRDIALSSLKLNDNKRYFLFMSRLHKKKGLELLLSVWAAIAKDYPDWCLLIAGPDYSDYENKIKQLVSQQNLEDSIKTLGMLSGHLKLSAFSSSDFFVLPSFSENFGVVIGEALAAGLPTITTKGTPWSELDEYSCGQCIELSKENLHEALLSFLELDKAKLTAMSESGKKLILDRYSWASQAKKFMEVMKFLNGDLYSTEVVKLE